MATSNVEVVIIGIPGPPGSGVSAAEKASFVTLPGANVFTNTQTVQENSTAALTVEKEDGTDVLVIDTTNKEIEAQNGAKLRGFSDANTTETFNIDAATGNAQFDGPVTTPRVVGDTSVWSLVIDGGGSAITTGVKLDLVVPYNAIVTSWDILADQSGSIVVDLWQDTYGSYPPTNADSITTSEKPTLSSASKNQDNSLNSGNGWAVTQGRVLRVNVDSAATVTRVCIALHVTRT